tara:strand:+ start:1114 stop:1596 length:483 start_codon:yes stop_codon:yes gene_type:complete
MIISGMDFLLLFIDSLQAWHFLLIALFILIISTILGDTDILPWIALSVFLVGLLEFVNVSATFQLIALPFFIIFSLILSRKYIYMGEENKIAEDISALKNQRIRVVKLNDEYEYKGEGVSSNGKRWNVYHVSKMPLEVDTYYSCKEIEGLNLIIDNLEEG